MSFLGKYERHINIIAKFFIIIILLFICYRIVIYDNQINELRQAVTNIEADMAREDYGMPVLLGTNAAAAVREESDSITVNITGAINSPGVYTLDYGSRLVELIELSGGALDDADLDRVNQAAHLQDASLIRIPFIGEYEDLTPVNVVIDTQTPSSSGASNVTSALVNVNTASRSELETLPGVGPVIAGNIIDFRERNGPFNHIEDLLSVNRVGGALLDSMRHLIEL